MILGMSMASFTLLHVVFSLVGIVAGLIAVFGMLQGRLLSLWTGIFLLTTILTSVTGFMFPNSTFTPAMVFGVLSLILLAVAVAGLYVFKLAGPARWLYIVGAVGALYLNMFVGVVQSFQKIAFLQPLAPTQSEGPFLAAQVVLLALALVAGYLAVKRYHPNALVTV